MLERRPQRARRLGPRRPRGRPRRHAPRRRAHRPLGAAARPGPRDRRDLGLRQARRRDARFSDDDLRLAETFATRAAVAVDLSERVARDALRRVVAAQELERRRLARELHDETGPGADLDPARAQAARRGRDAPEAVAELRELVVATLQDVRRLAVELRPKALDDFGLVPALERLTAGLRASRPGSRSTSRRARSPSGLPRRGRDGALPDRAGVAHERGQARPGAAASASLLDARRWQDQGGDRGRRHGLRPDDASARRLRPRRHARAVALLDGTLDVESSETSGTTLAVEVPVR